MTKKTKNFKKSFDLLASCLEIPAKYGKQRRMSEILDLNEARLSRWIKNGTISKSGIEEIEAKGFPRDLWLIEEPEEAEKPDTEDLRAFKKDSLAARLKYLRERRGLSQAAAAQKIGIGHKTLQDHEYGRRPSADSLEKYTDFYGCNFGWLLTGQGSETKARPFEMSAHLSKNQHAEIMECRDSADSGPEPQIGKAVEKLIRILTSGDHIVIRAILSNLDAFDSIIETKTHHSERIAQLEKDYRTVLEKLKALEPSPGDDSPDSESKTEKIM